MARPITRSLSKRFSAPPQSNTNERDGREEAELSVDARAPGVIKLFGESVVRGVQYKAVLASTRSTAQELIKQALERYGLPSENFADYVLYDAVGVIAPSSASEERSDDKGEDSDVSDDVSSSSSQDSRRRHRGSRQPSSSSSGIDGSFESSGGWTQVSARVLGESDRPLELHMYWKPPEGFSRRFELHRRVDLVRRASADDTFGLNDNARKIMMAKVSPGVIPPSVHHTPHHVTSHVTFERRWDESDIRERFLDRVTPLHLWSDDRDNMNKSAYGPRTRCPYSGHVVHPYLLTVRAYDIRRDLFLYGLEWKSTAVGKDTGRSERGFIGLLAEDVLEFHCCISVKAMPANSAANPDRHRYSYCLQIEVCDQALVTLNGLRVSHSIRVYPGDLLGIGKHYLFLYKDPTGGHDIPATLPWLQGAYEAVRRHGILRRHISDQEAASSVVKKVNFHDYDDSDDSSENRSTVDTPLFLAYPRHKESEILKHIASINFSGHDDYPLSTAVLMLSCHAYAIRRFPPSHQAGFFRRLVQCARNRVTAVSKALSMEKYQSELFTAGKHGTGKDRTEDPLLELICWLSNVERMRSHLTSHDFQAHLVKHILCDPEFKDSVQEVTESFEEMVAFIFQQVVYSITKALYLPVCQVLNSPSQALMNQALNSSTQVDSGQAHLGMDRVVQVLCTTLNLLEELTLHQDIIVQLLTYLIFFISTTLFNKLLAKGPGSNLFCWSEGVRLQACVNRLEEWVESVGLDVQYLRVSERLLTLVDLLATSRRTLLRMDWSAFRKQFSPLSEAQLLQVLTGYKLGEGVNIPSSWLPPSGIALASEDDFISLSSHPSFVLPSEGILLDLTQVFPPALYRHLERIQRLFPLEGEDPHSDTSSMDDSPLQTDFGKTLFPPSHSQRTFYVSENQSVSHSENSRLNSQVGNGHLTHCPDVLQRRPPPPRPPPRQQSLVRSCNKNYSNGCSRQQLPTQQKRSGYSQSGRDHPPRIPPKQPERGPHSSSDDTHLVDFVPVLSLQECQRSEQSCENRGVKGYTEIPSDGYSQRDMTQAGDRKPDLDLSSQTRANPAPNATGNQEHAGDIRSGSSQRLPDHRPQREYTIQDSEIWILGSGHTIQDPQNSNMPFRNQTSCNQTLHRTTEIPDAEGAMVLDPDPSYPATIADLTITQDRLHTCTTLVSRELSNDNFTLQDYRFMQVTSTVDNPYMSPVQECRPPTYPDPPSEFTSSADSSSIADDGDRKGNHKRPEVEYVDMQQAGFNRSLGDYTTVDKYPDDIYVDVSPGKLSASSRKLKVLPLEDGDRAFVVNGNHNSQSSSKPARVRYRHKMLQKRDTCTKGEITGEVFTLTLIKDGARLGMGLVDGMYTQLKLPGLYVRNVMSGTPAALCGHIRVGDRILAINGLSIVGTDYNVAMKMIRSAGPRLELLIAKCDRTVMAQISAS